MREYWRLVWRLPCGRVVFGPSEWSSLIGAKLAESFLRHNGERPLYRIHVKLKEQTP